MPELPDVEGFKRYFVRHAAGHRIVTVEVLDRALVRNATAPALERALDDRRFTRARRHGKWLIAETGGPCVLFHFGMTGLLAWSRSADERHPHDRVIFRLTDGELRYRNMRRFGGIWLARDAREREAVIGDLGPDALAVRRAEFHERIGGRRGAIKPVLMDQRLIAGLGNLLCDEVLWRARLNPFNRVPSIDERARDAIYDRMNEVLRESNRHGRVPPKEGWLTGVRDDRSGRCPRCGARLRRAPLGGRTTCWCPRCQRRRR